MPRGQAGSVKVRKGVFDFHGCGNHGRHAASQNSYRLAPLPYVSDNDPGLAAKGDRGSHEESDGEAGAVLGA